MTPKTKKTTNLWVQCEKCSTNITQKDIEQHASDCPPNLSSPLYNFITNNALFGTLEIKTNEEIKSVSQHDKDNMVFLSQSAIQLCSLAIGKWAEVKSLDLIEDPPVARVVWPTIEKSVTSVLVTKHCLELSSLKTDTVVKVSQIATPTKEARQIAVVILNGPRMMELSSELQLRLRKSHVDRLLARGNKISILYYGKQLIFEVKTINSTDSLVQEFSKLSIQDTEFHRIMENTSWILYRDELEYKKEVTANNLFEKIGGLDDEIEEINDVLNSALGKSSQKLNFRANKGILLYGNSGTGKTLLAHALAKSNGAHVVSTCATDLYTKYAGNTDEEVKKLFDCAIENAPSIVVLDEVDILCPSRTNRITDAERRICSSILTFFDRINESEDCKVFVIGTTIRLESVDSAFRRCGRFDREIEIGTPNPKSRFVILKKLLADLPSCLDDEVLRDVANSAHGFVGADLVSLCSRAASHATKFGKAEVSLDDFKFALTRVRPSAMREVQIEVPNVKWSDIGGQEHLKLVLKQSVEWPLKHADSFTRLGITPPRGVLMFGPPGCSKTMIAKALATESGLNFLSIKGPEVFSKWVGESERAIREIFRKARQVAPSVIFFDEIDALGGERSTGTGTSAQERVLAQLLTELDGVTALGDVTILAATNRPDIIDKALLRPGRLDRIVYVPLPDENTRREIFKIKLLRMPIVNVNVEELISATNGYSGAEVIAVCHEAAMAALEGNLNASTIKMKHFTKALDLIKPRTDESLIKMYEDYFKNK